MKTDDISKAIGKFIILVFIAASIAGGIFLSVHLYENSSYAENKREQVRIAEQRKIDAEQKKLDRELEKHRIENEKRKYRKENPTSGDLVVIAQRWLRDNLDDPRGLDVLEYSATPGISNIDGEKTFGIVVNFRSRNAYNAFEKHSVKFFIRDEQVVKVVPIY